MPKETDIQRLELLHRILVGNTDAGELIVKPRAHRGSSEPDDLGLERLLGTELSRRERERQLRDAIATGLMRLLTKREQPSAGTEFSVNRVEYGGDDVRGDPALFYEFELNFAGQDVYVKAEFQTDDPECPVLEIRSVKRQS